MFTRLIFASFLLFVLFGTAVAEARISEKSLDKKLEEVRSLRSQGGYEQTIEILEALLREHTESAEIRQRLYNEIVFTLFLSGDEAACEEEARKALILFPDIEADPKYFPSQINELYRQLRRELFGSLVITTDPDTCFVRFGELFQDYSPIRRKYVRTGEYRISIHKEGYHDRKRTVRIDPGKAAILDISLKKKKVERAGKKRLRLGFEAGANFSSLGTSGLGVREYSQADRDGVLDYTMGAFFNLEIESRLMFQSGVRWVRFGETGTFDTGVVEYQDTTAGLTVRTRSFGEYDRRLSYLAVPFQIKAVLLGRPRIFVAGGPEVGVIVSARVKGTEHEERTEIGSPPDPPVESTTFDRFDESEKDEMQPLNISYSAGFGVEIPVRSYWIVINVRYSRSITIPAEQGVRFFSGGKTREIVVSLGFIF